MSGKSAPSCAPLTERQQTIFEFISAFYRRYRYGPTVREIGEAMNIRSPNGVSCHLKSLSQKGWITWDRHKARTIRPMVETAAKSDAELLLSIANLILSEGEVPTFQELSDKYGHAVFEHLRRWERQGLVDWDPSRPRSLRFRIDVGEITRHTDTEFKVATTFGDDTIRKFGSF